MVNTTETTDESPTDESQSPEQDWGKIALCVSIAIVVALAIHYALFEMVFTGADLSGTMHALAGMVLFFVAGFASFGLFY